MSSYEITSIKSFKSWLKSHAPEAAQWYGRIALGGSKCLLVSNEPVIHFNWGAVTPDELPLYLLTLPPLPEAREWWCRFWDGETTVFRYHKTFEIACIAAAGTWHSLSPWYVCRSKDEFTEMSEAQLARIVGQPTFDEMVHEYNILGISTRSLRLRNLATRSPPPTMKNASTNTTKKKRN